jgi:hypothetical protein
VKQKLCEKMEKSEKKVKKAKKNNKIDLNFASFCFASKQKLLNRSEAKNFKRKKRKNAKK